MKLCGDVISWVKSFYFPTKVRLQFVASCSTLKRSMIRYSVNQPSEAGPQHTPEDNLISKASASINYSSRVILTSKLPIARLRVVIHDRKVFTYKIRHWMHNGFITYIRLDSVIAINLEQFQPLLLTYSVALAFPLAPPASGSRSTRSSSGCRQSTQENSATSTTNTRERAKNQTASCLSPFL